MPDQFSPEVAWASDFRSTIVVLRGADPSGPAWRALIQRLRKTPRPVLLYVLEDGHLGVQSRGELADALGHRVPVSVVALSDRGRSLGTALRWLGADVQVYDQNRLAEAAANIGLDVIRLRSSTQALITTGLDRPPPQMSMAVASWR